MGDEVMTGQPLLQVNSVETYYGNIRALAGVDVHVNKGEIVSLIGANGAGKSTLMMTICGSPQARTGSVVFEGRDITRMAGITASSRMISGVMRSTIPSAAVPDVAISTEKPDCSSASVKKPSASAESSTSRTMSRGRAGSGNGFHLFVEVVQEGHVCFKPLPPEHCPRLPPFDRAIACQRRAGHGGKSSLCAGRKHQQAR